MFKVSQKVGAFIISCHGNRLSRCGEVDGAAVPACLLAVLWLMCHSRQQSYCTGLLGCR